MRYEIEIHNPLTGEYIDTLEGDTDCLSADQQEAWFGKQMPKTPPQEREDKCELTPRKKGVGRGVKKGTKRGPYRKDATEEGGMSPNSIEALAAFYQDPSNEGKSFFGDD